MAKRRRSSKDKPNGAMVKRKRPSSQLSDLPMDILCHIISLLPLKEAARTSIVSKHWRYVWCSRTNLEFSFRSVMRRSYKVGPFILHPIQEVLKRIDAVLKQHSGVGVEKREVDFSLNDEHANHIDRWLNFAIAAKTNQLILNFTSVHPIMEHYKFPFQLFDATKSSIFQSLTLGSVSLNKPANFKAFLNLKKLMLMDVNITDEELQLLLSNCNVLEFLGVARCRMLTAIKTPQLSDHFKHLRVFHCPLLQEIKLNYGLTTLEYKYEGPSIPIAPPVTLTNLSIESSDVCSALAYISTELPSTVRRLEMMSLKCEELERAILPEKPLKFIHLRHLRLEITFLSLTKRKSDVLDFASVLEAAPLMEKLEFHMWMDCECVRYRKLDGKLRSLPPKPYSHLKLVDITGFYGEKDQLELALHILKKSVALEAMTIDPKPTVAAEQCRLTWKKDGFSYVDGYRVAKKYLLRADRRGVVDVVKAGHKDIEALRNAPYKMPQEAK
ncbi:putative F-box/LRR-repeat protein At3g28410 [Triticum dicoccoides]|uniref:putative F-box/LRR-repeat protein At3g28410 n=1 Tax=Triticum dicoccoides TaxID=85692 RepID=UPI000E7902E5|nr:putative F-box/LRR-repeat protein At3g28410 [Triticum dicoccoides]XP_037486333.1 putative F-box/LRR-repeat protein At3g28410 [Triticum dicoccoides]